MIDLVNNYKIPLILFIIQEHLWIIFCVAKDQTWSGTSNMADMMDSRYFW